MNGGARIVVVGAGPVGLSAAALLTKQGVDCLVLEKRRRLSLASKASTFHPPTLEILREIGVIEPILAQGQVADRIQYRLNSGAVVSEFDHALLADAVAFPFRLHLEQSAITPLLAQRIRDSGHGEIRFGVEVVAAGTDEAGAWVDATVEGAAPERIRADYVLGADGAHSAVRGALGIELAGEDYPGKVLRLVVTDRLEDYLPGLGQISYIFDPDGRSISLLKMPDCWRIIIRLPKDFREDEVTKPEWYMPVVRHFMPAVPDMLALRGLDVYGASKMVADEYFRGRVFLAGDATHLSNTRGGMNMNCGIHDAYEMALAFCEALRTGRAQPAEAAAHRRRRVAVDELIPRTDRNVTGGPEWLEHIRATGADPKAARAMLWRTAMLDMAPQTGPAAAAVQQGVAQ